MTDPTLSNPAVRAERSSSHSVPAHVPDPVRRILEYVTYGTMSWLAWFWGAAVLLWIVSIVLISRYGELESSVWEFAGLSWTRWVQFAAGCVLAYATFPVFVAQGLTRRRVAQGSIVGIVVISAIGAAVITAVYAAELVAFGLADVDLALSERHLFDAPGQLWWVAVESLLVYAVYMASGWFVGLGFYRWGTVVGLLLTVPGLLPVVVVEASLSSSLFPESVDAVFLDLPAGGAVVLVVATWLVAVAATTRLLRDTPLRSRPR